MINRNVTEILIGAVVVITAVWFIYFVSVNTSIVSNDENYNLAAEFRSVEGISIGTDVRLAGVKIGTVKDIKLDPDTYLSLIHI